eukprot:1145905-Pelagomonas_calceolata.AAC.4
MRTCACAHKCQCILRICIIRPIAQILHINTHKWNLPAEDVVAEGCWGQPALLPADVAVDVQAGGVRVVKFPLSCDLIPQQLGVEPRNLPVVVVCVHGQAQCTRYVVVR